MKEMLDGAVVAAALFELGRQGWRWWQRDRRRIVRLERRVRRLERKR